MGHPSVRFRWGIAVLVCAWTVCQHARSMWAEETGARVDAETVTLIPSVIDPPSVAVPMENEWSSALSFELTPLVEPLPASIIPIYHLTMSDQTGAVSNAVYEETVNEKTVTGAIETESRASPKLIPASVHFGDLRSFRLTESFTRSQCDDCGIDQGIGHERIMFAPMVVSPAIAANGIGFSFHFDQGLNVPDRAEFFWSSSRSGSSSDPSVDVIDTQVQLVVGSPKLTGITRYTLRSLDPTTAANTTGMGDMMVGVQSLLLDGKRLKVSSLLQTHLATGSTSRGLGVGHTSLEPGILWRYCASPSLYWFGEASYHVPIGGDPQFDGNVLTTGIAVSKIAWENDRFAALPTLEMRTLTFTSGAESIPGAGAGTDPRRVDGTTAVEFFPGIRMVLGPQLDWGLCEIGVSAGTVFADDDWFDSRIRLNVRFVR